MVKLLDVCTQCGPIFKHLHLLRTSFFFFTELTDLRDSLRNVSDIVQKLRTLGQTLRVGLDEARNNLTGAKTDCTNDPPSVRAGACDKIPTGDDLQPEADYNKVTHCYERFNKTKEESI